MLPGQLKKSNYGNAIAEIGKKKICFGNCGNAIVENEKKKNYEICEWVKKKSCLVHNIFTINHTWLIIISSKNLWQINCGNGIAENVKKKNCFGNYGNAIAENVKKKKKILSQLWQYHCRKCKKKKKKIVLAIVAMPLPKM